MLLLFIISLSLIFAHPSFALTLPISPIPTIITTPGLTTSLPSPSPTSSASNELLQIVKQRVQEKLKLITNPTISKKAIVGKIIQIDSQTLTLENSNTTVLATLSPETIFIDKNRNKTKATNFKIGQEILLMGFMSSQDNSFDAKRIVAIDLSPLILKRTVAVGKIVDISKTTPIFSLIPSKNKNISFQIKTDTKTVFTNSSDNAVLKFSDLKSGHKIIALIRPDEKNTKSYIAIKIIDLDYTPSPTPTKKP